MVDIKNLSPEEKEKLMRQLKAEEREAKDREKADRETYKKMVDETVPMLFEELLNVSRLLSESKKKVFDGFATVLSLKKELYNTKEDQQSHTFTTTDGNISITIGHRVVDNYDDTISAGIEKVNSYISGLATDENSSRLVKTIMRLLRQDSKGNLKASRVVELQNLADEINDPLLMDGISIIRSAYRPAKTCEFVEVSFKDDQGRQCSLPLSMSTANLE
jgi:hypothetical protein